jgi:hypothetical protein
MLTYEKLLKKKNRLNRLTGLSPEQYRLLCARLRPLWAKAEIQRLSRPHRRRVIGAGRRYKLSTLEDKLLLILLFYRAYLSYDLLEILFDLENSQIYRLLKKLAPLIEVAADPYLEGLLRRVDKTAKRIKTVAEFIERFPDLKDLILDATEQRKRKPSGERRQRRYYSGKKKHHTLKTGLVISSGGRILALTPPVGGQTHDQALFRSATLYRHLPEKANKYGDLGF